MTTRVRKVGEPGTVQYKAFRHQLKTDNGEQRWNVIAERAGTPGQWDHLLWCDSEEHALLAVLFLQEGGHVKINGPVIADDNQLPRKHKTD